MCDGNSRLGFVVAGLLLGILMAAMVNTIVSTAMATIVAELGGLDSTFGSPRPMWLRKWRRCRFSASCPTCMGANGFRVWHRDLFARFGAVRPDGQYRAAQHIPRNPGIGGGALMPIAFALMFDVFPIEKRGAMGGLFGAVFGISSLAGPCSARLLPTT